VGSQDNKEKNILSIRFFSDKMVSRKQVPDGISLLLDEVVAVQPAIN
jgi:hypothetical protein